MVCTAQIKSFQEAKNIELTDKQKCKSLNKCFAADPVKGRVMPPKHIIMLHSFLAHGWLAVPYISQTTVDWSHIDQHYEGDRKWFSITVYVAKRKWRRFMAADRYQEMKEGRKEKGHATLAKHDYCNRKYSRGIPNMQAVSDTDKEVVKALICEYREWQQNMDEEQTEAWYAIPKCVSKRANYIPNFIWVPKNISGEDEHFLNRQSAKLVEDQYRRQVKKAKAKEYNQQAAAQGFAQPSMARRVRQTPLPIAN